MNELNKLRPVLEAILLSECSNACSLLIRHLEDRLFSLLTRCLNAVLRPWGQRIIKINPEDRETVRKVFLPYKKEVLALSQNSVSITKKRKIIDKALKTHPEFHQVLAGFAKTLCELIDARSKKKEL